MPLRESLKKKIFFFNTGNGTACFYADVNEVVARERRIANIGEREEDLGSGMPEKQRGAGLPCTFLPW